MELAHALMAGGHDWYSRYWDTSQRRGKSVKKTIDALTNFYGLFNVVSLVRLANKLWCSSRSSLTK